MEINVACCFCGNKINSDQLNPCDITISINWDREPGQKNDQFFWTHYECFKKKLHVDVKPHLFLDLLIDENSDPSYT